jgi:multiple antibiotic resistance protein
MVFLHMGAEKEKSRPACRTEMEQHLQAIATVLSLVNPVICGAMFARIEVGQSGAARLADATKAALAVLVILAVAALVGASVLQVFGVSLDAFAVAGGGVLSWIGFTMLRGNSAPAQHTTKDGAAAKRSITPVILFAASPGTITGVITLAVAHAKRQLPVTVLVAVAVATAAMWIVMVLMARGGTRAPGGLLRDTATKFMGLLIVAMGVQLALTGARSFFLAQP